MVFICMIVPAWSKGFRAAALIVLALFGAHASACEKPLYLTLDTGGMHSAELIAQILNKHDVRATFFLSNEKTFRGDFALDDSWRAYWQARVREGHAFGSHTWNHGRIVAASDERIGYRPAHGPDSGRLLTLGAAEFCTELRRVGEQFERLTGRKLNPLWRAPGGFTTPQAIRAASGCGFTHVHWSAAGFLGDELPSERASNAALLEKTLRDVRSGDILMAHLGIWSRKEVYAPTLDSLIDRLKSRGFCFQTIADAPQAQAIQSVRDRNKERSLSR